MKIDTKGVLSACADGQQNRSVHESKIERPAIGQEDPVKQPSHYKHGKYEVIDEMLLAFGPQRTYDFCIMNAWKYRSRAPYKGNCEQDMAKADQYMSMAKEIADSNPAAMYSSTKLIRER